MPDNASPTGTKNVIVSSAENHRSASGSCGAVRPAGFDGSIILCGGWKRPIHDANGLVAISTKVRNARTISLNVEIDDCRCYVQCHRVHDINRT